jgi:hypothetical protein
MKINLEVISAVLNELFERNGIAPRGAIPYRLIVAEWEETRLRSSDIALAIEGLYRQGRIEIEARMDGVWLRRRSILEGRHSPLELLPELLHRLRLEHTLAQIRRRESHAYAGADRRRTAGPSLPTSTAPPPDSPSS